MNDHTRRHLLKQFLLWPTIYSRRGIARIVTNNKIKWIILGEESPVFECPETEEL